MKECFTHGPYEDEFDLCPKCRSPLDIWTQDEPTEQGQYWIWLGEDEPFIVNVLWSETEKRCFIPAGQHGWNRAQSMDEYMNAYWGKVETPFAPDQPQVTTRDIEKKYMDLIMTVETKYPGETRHDTARRYISEAENRETLCGKAKIQNKSGTK